MITFNSIQDAQARIDKFIHRTPIVESTLLNHWSGHRIYFKAESLQKIGAFKARGGCNAVARLMEKKKSPQWIVANSSGNHAQAVAWASNQHGLKSRIYMPENVSRVKAQATRFYGAELVFGKDRAEADQMVEEASWKQGVFWVPPFNHPDVIAGQGTSAAEAFKDLPDVDAVFAPCGGGGLLSGTLVATRTLSPASKVVGVEPLNANDAAQSLRQGSIHTLNASPDTLADGARTLAVGDLTFEHLKELDDFYEVSEENLIYWTQWLNHLLKIRVEPTSAMCMQAVWEYLAHKSTSQRVLVILSGGNMDQDTIQKIWSQDYLTICPGDVGNS